MNRRDLLRMSLYAGAGLLARRRSLLERDTHSPALEIPRAQSVAAKTMDQAPKPPALTSFVDPLPIPPVIPASQNGKLVDVQMREFRQKIHRDLPSTPLW